MKIGIYNLEPKYVNIALEKIKMFHVKRGDQVEDYFALNHESYNKIYCSSIFGFSKKQYVTDDMICGGTGFIDKFSIKLPRKFDKMKPKINMGFTSRGCNRKCSFCVVPKKEGKFKIVGDIYDFWNRHTQIINILDNNILFNKKHFIKICEQIKKENIKVSFSQGLDIRLIDDDFLEWLVKIKHHKKIKFAWDNMKDEKMILSKLDKVLTYINKHKIMVYVLCGFNTTFEQDMYRLKTLREYSVDAFIMRYHKKSKLLNEFSRWNNIYLFRNTTFENYLKARNMRQLIKNKVSVFSNSDR